MSFQLPKSVLIALASLNDAGHEAYLVGGSVRDYLRGVTPHDFDITTSATPEETLEVFSSYRTVKTGIKHGTVTVLIDSMPLEITTYRIDGDYRDRRRPDSVFFTKNLCEDLSRRDFTVNAMAYHPKEGIVDPFSGKEDLESGCIRAVGRAEVRFEEDALRILRALRFSSVLGFPLEKETEEAALQKAKNLSAVSPERIREELAKLLLGVACDAVLKRYSSILSLIVSPGEFRSIFLFALPPLARTKGLKTFRQCLQGFALITERKKRCLPFATFPKYRCPPINPRCAACFFPTGEKLLKNGFFGKRPKIPWGRMRQPRCLKRSLKPGIVFLFLTLLSGGESFWGSVKGRRSERCFPAAFSR